MFTVTWLNAAKSLFGIASKANRYLLSQSLSNDLGWGSNYDRGDAFRTAAIADEYTLSQAKFNEKGEVTHIIDSKVENLTKKQGLQDGFEAEVTEVKKYKYEDGEKKLQSKKEIEVVEKENEDGETSLKYKITKYEKEDGELKKQGTEFKDANPREGNTNKNE